MVKSHLKRFATPTTWKIKKKGITFIARPNPGAHPIGLSIPLSVLMKDILKCAQTTREVKKLLKFKEVLVDERRVQDHHFPVGLMDVVNLKPANEHYRVVFDEKGNLTAIKIDAKESKLKLSRVKKKTTIKGGKMQINLSDSRNIIVDKGDYKLGDSIVLELPSQKIVNHFKLEKGAAILLIAGKHIAETGVVEKTGGHVIIYKNEKGETKTTSRKYAFVIGKDKPAIKIK